MRFNASFLTCRLLVPWLLLLACVPPAPAAAEDQDLQAASEAALALLINQGQRQACQDAVDTLEARASGGWSAGSLAWLRARSACVPLSLYDAARPMAAQALVDRFSPWIALADSAPMPDADTVAAATRLRMQLWQALEFHGSAALAQAQEQAQVTPLIARLRHDPGDALAQAALREWVRGHYGNLTRQARMQHWQQVLDTELGEGHPLALRMLAALAFSYRLVGRPEAALAAAEQLHGRVQRHQAGDAAWRMSAASEFGLALAGAGRLADAMDQLRLWQELDAHQQPPNHLNQLRLHANLAALAFELGDDDGAVAHADDAMRHAGLTGDLRYVTDALSTELVGGQARLRRGDADAATALRGTIERLQATSLGVGSAADALSRHAERVGDAALLAWSHDVMQRHAAYRWDPLHAARPLLALVAARVLPAGSAERQRQLALAAAIGLAGRSGSLEAQAWFALADERAITAADDQAIWRYKHGANVLQALRQGVAADDATAQRLWLADHEAPLRRLVGLLIDRGRLVEAQQALRVLRDEELHEYQRRSRGARATRRSGAAAPVLLTARERAVEFELQALAARIKAVQPAADARADAEASHTQRMARPDDPVHALLDGVTEALHELLARPLPAADATARTQGPAAVTRAHARGAGAPDEATLPAGSARVLYFVRDASLDIAVQRGRRWHRVSLPVGRRELARQVHALRVALSTPQGDVQAPAQALYRRLLQPVQALVAGAVRLHLAPDGVLRLLPFAALHDGRRWASERWTLLLEEGLAAGAQGPAKPTPRPAARVLALGRSQGDADHAPLPAVRDELASLAAAGAGVQAAGDAAFTARALADGLTRRPDVVHLASHFVLGSSHEEGAYLLLGDGERLPLSRLRALPWQGVHLAVLSACDTGVPDPSADGRQAGGLAAALQQAGAANVLATLWPVTDGSTAQWMQSFYRPWRAVGGMGTPRALPSADWVARTQRAWLRRHAGTSLAHPHHWAGFVWMAGR